MNTQDNNDDLNSRIAEALVALNKIRYIDGAHHKIEYAEDAAKALLGCPQQEVSAVDANDKPYTYTDRKETPDYLTWRDTPWWKPAE